MKFGRTGNENLWSLITNIELSNPPIYSPDRQFIQSKDGMVWVPVAPHAAVPAVSSGVCGSAVASAGAIFGGCIPTSGPFITVHS